jgi:hypothetical protein
MKRRHDDEASEEITYATIGVVNTHLYPTSHINNDAYEDKQPKYLCALLRFISCCHSTRSDHATTGAQDGRNYGQRTMMISTMNADNEAAWTASGYDSWNPSAFLGDNEDIEK